MKICLRTKYTHTAIELCKKKMVFFVLSFTSWRSFHLSKNYDSSERRGCADKCVLFCYICFFFIARDTANVSRSEFQKWGLIDAHRVWHSVLWFLIFVIQHKFSMSKSMRMQMNGVTLRLWKFNDINATHFVLVGQHTKHTHTSRLLDPLCVCVCDAHLFSHLLLPPAYAIDDVSQKNCVYEYFEIAESDYVWLSSDFQFFLPAPPHPPPFLPVLSVVCARLQWPKLKKATTKRNYSKTTSSFVRCAQVGIEEEKWRKRSFGRVFAASACMHAHT